MFRCKINYQISTALAPPYTPTTNTRQFPGLNILTNIWCFYFLILVLLGDVKWQLNLHLPDVTMIFGIFLCSVDTLIASAMTCASSHLPCLLGCLTTDSGYKSSVRQQDCEYILPVNSLSFYFFFNDTFDRSFIFNEGQSIFCVCMCARTHTLRNLCLHQNGKDSLLWFLSETLSF